MIETLLYAILIVIGLYIAIQIIKVIAVLFVAFVAMLITVAVLAIYGIVEGGKMIVKQINKRR
jgi:hypothetical protein